MRFLTGRAAARPALAATKAGAGSASRGHRRGARAGEHERAVEPRGARAGHVGVEAIADHERAARAQPVQRREEELGLGLAHRARLRAGGGLDRGDDRRRSPATARRASGRSRRGSCTTPRRRAASAWTAPRSSAKSKRSWPLTTTTSARSARSEPLRIRSPASVTWRWTAAEPITKAVACPDSASTCCRAPPAVTTSSREAWKPRPPQLAHDVLLAVARVVGHEGQPPPGRAQRADGLDRTRRGLVAHPNAAVEVQEEGVVGREARRDGHGSAPIILAAVRSTRLALCVALLLLAGCGGDDRRRSATTAASDGRGRAGHVQEGRGARAQGRAAPQQAQDDARAGQALRRRPADQLRRRSPSAWPPAARPKTAASFADLVKRGFYDGLTFHRIVPRLRHPGRRPARHRASAARATRVVETPPGDLAYTTGVVAMAKTEADPAGASGSQFFIVTARRTPGCRPTTRVAGGVVRGMDVAQRIGRLPVDDAGAPDLAGRHREGDAQNRVSRGRAGSRQSGSSWRASLTASPTARMPVCSSGTHSSSSADGLGGAVQPRVLGVAREHHRHAVVHVGQLLGGRAW